MPAIEIPTDQIALQGQLYAAADVNPDMLGRAAPVMVRIYELASDEVFNRIDFFSLYDHEPAVLGPALLRARSFQLAPGQALDITGNVEPRTQFIGVVAAFRDLDRARWRVLAPLPPKTAKISEPHRVAALVQVGSAGLALSLGPAAGASSSMGNSTAPGAPLPEPTVNPIVSPGLGQATVGMPAVEGTGAGVPGVGVPAVGAPGVNTLPPVPLNVPH